MSFDSRNRYRESSVKVLCVKKGEVIQKVREEYKGSPPKCWSDAISRALKKLNEKNIRAIGLSSQVGTYLVNEKDVISWNDPVGRAETEKIKSIFTQSEFEAEISMPHPDIISYPIPRIMYIKENFSDIKSICQPKDYICKMLTGRYVSDIYSWRGLANLNEAKYSEKFLDFLDIESNILPKLIQLDDTVGKVTKNAAEFFGIPEGITVVAGLNDFYASLLGMGVSSTGDMFDITGTSEHLGIIFGSVYSDTKMVSSPYIKNNVLYGVTASSGASLDMAIKSFNGADTEFEEYMPNENTPIFLPYLNGERAPIFDSDARGVFFGISGKTTDRDFAYAILEGVCFSLCHIKESLNTEKLPSKMIVSGGAAKNNFLNRLKADILNVNVEVPQEIDTSALGAAVTAVAYVEKKSLSEAAKDLYKTKKVFSPKPNEVYKKRFDIYKKIYVNTINLFKDFKEVHK